MITRLLPPPLFAAAALAPLLSAKPAGAAPEFATMRETTGTRLVGGVYPHLTMYSDSRADGSFALKGHEECGIGAVVPWAGKLWAVTYAPHMPHGSHHKLYSIDPQTMAMTIHPESVGGTPANRMIHDDSGQLFLAHYAIDKTGKVRVIDIKTAPGRMTAVARHLTDPANKVYLFDMENMVYEVDVHTLAATRLFKNPIPDYHGKGAYTAQGKVVVSNNGATDEKSLDNPKDWQIADKEKHLKRGPEDRGCLATWDGKTWEVIERRQYTEVTGPGGIRGNANPTDPLWTMGWDKRAVRLQVMDGGKFHLYLLPKASLNNDAAHGWFTEWPRIREVGGGRFLMDMHGMFFDFPKTFRPGHTAGLAPIGRHLRYVPDFCDWNGRLVLATDETSIQGNPLAGQPQSNLWFGDYADLRTWGEASAAGAIWAGDAVKGGEPSAPFLIKGFARRVAHLAAEPGTTFSLEIDRAGDGHWTPCAAVTCGDSGYAHHVFPEDFDAQWIRVTLDRDSAKATAAFTYSDKRAHDPAGAGRELFAPLADVGESAGVPAVHLFPSGKSRNLEVVTRAADGAKRFSQLNAESFTYAPLDADKKLAAHAEVKPIFSVDAASVVMSVTERIDGKRAKYTLRLPKGDAAFDRAFDGVWPRGEREVESERTLANIHGTFYEVPFWIVGQSPLFTKMKPVASHTKRIDDFCTWRGLLVLSGVKPGAPAGDRVIRSADGATAVWVGGIDDLWKLGKPVGKGGPWKDTVVKAGVASDPYLMNGFDKKTLTLTAAADCRVTVEVDVDLLSGFHRYATFTLKAGEPVTHVFPAGFGAHWVRVVSDADTTATAQLVYE